MTFAFECGCSPPTMSAHGRGIGGFAAAGQHAA
jgi:hypothetical protein